jgi:cell surface protein SprA
LGDGKSLIDIKPQGDVNIIAGYQGQQINNPTLPERAQSNGGFDFNMNANVQILGNIGEKLKLPINYNTLANFDFENQLKLNYQGDADQILKSLEAGNLSFQTKGRLIPSAQNLFGIKTQLQFGKLFITAAVANSRSTRQSQTLQGGASTQLFDKKLDDYDENRNFLVGQYFVEKYNDALKTIPVVSSQVQIQRMEVWVTNRNGATTDARDIVALQDLGEANPYNPSVPRFGGSILPDNNANGLMSILRSDTFFRDPTRVSTLLGARGLRPVEDFEKTFARKLSPSDYYFDPQVGFVLLNTLTMAEIFR